MKTIPECPHCHIPLPNKRSNQVTCGAKQCLSAQNRVRKMSYSVEKTCAAESCNTKFIAKRPEIKTCGSNACKEEFKNRKQSLNSDLTSKDVSWKNIFLKMPPLLTRDMYI